MNQKYEAIFIIKESEDSSEIQKTIDIIDNIVISEKFNIYCKEEKGLRNLAYEIKGAKKGYYYYIEFEGPKSLENKTGKISININTIEEVLKHIIVKLENN